MRLDEIFVRPELESITNPFTCGEIRKQNDGNITPGLAPPYLTQHIPTIHVRHENIEENEIGFRFFEPIHPLQSVLSSYDVIPDIPEFLLIDITNEKIVLDQEHAKTLIVPGRFLAIRFDMHIHISYDLFLVYHDTPLSHTLDLGDRRNTPKSLQDTVLSHE